MDETANEIAARIARTRERLGSNLRELENKVDAATDWREHFQDRPHLFLGAAFVGGIVLARMLMPRAASQRRSAGAPNQIMGVSGAVQTHAQQLWHNVQLALFGVATARIKDYIGAFVPEFDQHYRRAEQRAAGNPTITSIGANG